MRQRVRFVTGKEVPYAVSSKSPRGRRKGTPRDRVLPTCVCGRKLRIGKKGVIPPHKNRKTGQWCERRRAAQPLAKAGPAASVRSAAAPVTARRKAPVGDDVSALRAGQLRCAACLVWFDAPEGRVPAHRDRFNRRACTGPRTLNRSSRGS